MLRGVVLDFDGVVVNSEPLHLRAFQEVLAAAGATLSAHDYYTLYVGLDDAAMFRAFARDHEWRVSDSMVQGWIETKTVRMQALLRNPSTVFPGAPDRIRELAAAAPLAIASGALRDEILLVLEEAGLTTCFTAVVAAGETVRGKPAPDPYARAVDLLGRAAGGPLDPATVVAVEDTTQGLESARAAGLRTIAVTTTYPAELMTGAGAVVPSLREVTLLLLESLVTDDKGLRGRPL
jgi:beta-phosphoglucomutase